MRNTELQERVTHILSKSSISFKKLIIFCFCFILIIVLIVGVLFNISAKRKKYLFTSGRVFYVYYTTITSATNASEIVSTQQKSGGAGFPLEEGAKIYVCAFLYENFEDAMLVKNANIEAYNNGGIKEIKTQKMSARAQKVVKNCENYTKLVHLLEDCFNDFYSMAISHDENKLNESETFSRVFLWLTQANTLNDNFEKTDNISAVCELLAYEIKDFLATKTGRIERCSGLKLMCFKIINLYNAFANLIEGEKL